MWRVLHRVLQRPVCWLLAPVMVHFPGGLAVACCGVGKCCYGSVVEPARAHRYVSELIGTQGLLKGPNSHARANGDGLVIASIREGDCHGLGRVPREVDKM